MFPNFSVNPNSENTSGQLHKNHTIARTKLRWSDLITNVDTIIEVLRCNQDAYAF